MLYLVSPSDSDIDNIHKRIGNVLFINKFVNSLLKSNNPCYKTRSCLDLKKQKEKKKRKKKTEVTTSSSQLKMKS